MTAGRLNVKRSSGRPASLSRDGSVRFRYEAWSSGIRSPPSPPPGFTRVSLLPRVRRRRSAAVRHCASGASQERAVFSPSDISRVTYRNDPLQASRSIRLRTARDLLDPALLHLKMASTPVVRGRRVMPSEDGGRDRARRSRPRSPTPHRLSRRKRSTLDSAILVAGCVAGEEYPAAARLARHQASASRICASASGVVRTRRTATESEALRGVPRRAAFVPRAPRPSPR